MTSEIPQNTPNTPTRLAAARDGVPPAVPNPQIHSRTRANHGRTTTATSPEHLLEYARHLERAPPPTSSNRTNHVEVIAAKLHGTQSTTSRASVAFLQDHHHLPAGTPPPSTTTSIDLFSIPAPHLPRSPSTSSPKPLHIHRDLGGLPRRITTMTMTIATHFYLDGIPHPSRPRTTTTYISKKIFQ